MRADLQLRQLAGGDHRARGQAGRRSAGRLKGDSERGIRRDPAGEVGRDIEPDRLTRLNESERAWSCLAGRNQPQFVGAQIPGEQRGGCQLM